MEQKFVKLVESVNNALTEEVTLEINDFLSSIKLQLSEDKEDDIRVIAGKILNDTNFISKVVDVFKYNKNITSEFLQMATKLKDSKDRVTFGKMLYLLYTYQSKKGGWLRRAIAQGKGIKELEKLDADTKKGVDDAKKVIDKYMNSGKKDSLSADGNSPTESKSSSNTIDPSTDPNNPANDKITPVTLTTEQKDKLTIAVKNELQKIIDPKINDYFKKNNINDNNLKDRVSKSVKYLVFQKVGEITKSELQKGKKFDALDPELLIKMSNIDDIIKQTFNKKSNLVTS